MFGADLRTPFRHQRGGEPLLTEAPKRRPGPITASRRIELLVRVVLVAPAVGEPLAESGARDLTAEIGPEAAAGIASAGGDRALDVVQFGLEVRPNRARQSCGKLHERLSSPIWRVGSADRAALPRCLDQALAR
jgi:hypothetical protein